MDGSAAQCVCDDSCATGRRVAVGAGARDAAIRDTAEVKVSVSGRLGALPGRQRDGQSSALQWVQRGPRSSGCRRCRWLNDGGRRPEPSRASPLTPRVAGVWSRHRPGMTGPRLSARRHSNVVILTTSNITERIDVAFVDRADIRQYIGPPSAAAIFKIYLSCLEELMKVPRLPSSLPGSGVRVLSSPAQLRTASANVQ